VKCGPATPQKEEESEDKQWTKLGSVTLTESHERQNNDTLKQKDRGNCAIHPVGTSGSKEQCHANYCPEHEPG
jgi:hypothetical protein